MSNENEKVDTSTSTSTGSLTPEEFKQMDAEESARAAIDSLKKDQTSVDLAEQGASQQASPSTIKDPNINPYPGAGRALTEAELKAREQERAREHPFVAAVKEFLDAFAPEPKLGRLDHLYQNLRREYREVTGELDARAAVTGAGSEHESQHSSEVAD